MNEISSLISTLGFPIFCVLGLGFFIYRVYEKMSAQQESREERLYRVIADAQVQNQKLGETNAQFMEILQEYRTDIKDIREDVQEIKVKINQ